MADVPAAFLEVAAAFSAERQDCHAAGGVRDTWKFWSFRVAWDGGSFLFEPFDGATGPYHRCRTSVEGVVDELGRQVVDVHCVGLWSVGVTATAHRGRLATAAVWVATQAFRRTAFGRLGWVGVHRDTDPAGWELAVGALYSRQLGPLLDYVRDSPLYAECHDALDGALADMRGGDGD